MAVDIGLGTPAANLKLTKCHHTAKTHNGIWKMNLSIT